MEFLSSYGLFLAKSLTIVIAVLVVFVTMFVLYMRSREETGDHLEVKHLNKRYEAMALAIKSAMLPKKAFKQALKQSKTAAKAADKQDPEAVAKRIFVIEFTGDLRASAVTSLRAEVTAILEVATASDEVLVCVESAGGTVHGYGLAASQLQRIKDRGIPLIVAVDKVAASGGYMMACVADRILAAPFAILGSIGVLAQIPNFNRLLKKHDIDFEQITAGQHKRTLTLFGENTDADRDKFREELEDAHLLFKDFVRNHRDQVDIEQIATGEYWYGTRALALKLVDEIRTSDDYLTHSARDSEIYQIRYRRRQSWLDKLGHRD